MKHGRVRRLNRNKLFRLSNVLLFLLTLFLGLGITEILLRTLLPEGGIGKNSSLKMNHHSTELGSPMSREYDNLPLRLEGTGHDICLWHNDFSLQYCQNNKGDNTFRIIFIGDSVTEGQEIDTVLLDENTSFFPEHRFTNLLEKKFRSHDQGAGDVEVLNFAKAGYNLRQINYVFKEEVLKCNPDLVIYGFFQNDISSTDLSMTKENVTVASTIKVIRYVLEIPFQTYFLKNMVTYRLLNEAMITILRKINIDPDVQYYYFSFEEAYDDLYEIATLAEMEGIDLFIINFPYIGRYCDTNDFLERFHQRTEIDYLDICQNLMKKVSVPKTLVQDNIHYNKKGHEVVAEILYEEIMSRQLLQ